jgi:uncharacterized MAPEG superfamily protein
MTTELTLLGWTLVLALVQVLLPSMLRSRETGMSYNAGPRDQPAGSSGRRPICSKRCRCSRPRC